MGDVTPLFIAGMGRSGTTTALRVASAHPSIMLNGEISLAVLKQYLILLETVESRYSKKEAVRDGWFERKADYMFASFGYLAKGGVRSPKKQATATFIGHKAPRLETLFDSYESHFASVGLKPRYFYCARSAFDCWRSYRQMPWNPYDDVDAFLKHYVASYENLKRMREAAPGRVFVLNLHELVASSDPVAFYRARMFAPLGLDLPEQTATKIAKFVALRSESAHATLPDSDRRAIASHPRMRALFDEMFAPYAAWPPA